MMLCGIDAPFECLPAPLPIWRAQVTIEQWLGAARAVHSDAGRLLALWGSDTRARQGGFSVCAAYVVAQGLVCLVLPLYSERYPDLSAIFPAAARMQRAIADLLGLEADGGGDHRPWLRHSAWPRDYFPLRAESSGQESFSPMAREDYAFVAVEGEGVHEIAVGPVHAGIIEPGHFRFSVVGEKVLRLEERLGYTHKGVEKLFEHTPPLQGYRLAGRIAGDSTVAYAWAYAMALESAARIPLAEPDAWARALLLERERVANHLGDLGALGNDAGFAFGLSQFSMLRETWLRLNQQLFGHRFLMDCIVPGGSAFTLERAGRALLLRQCDQLEIQLARLHAIYDEHAGLQDRFMNTGRVAPHLAAELGLCGMAGRASAQSHDLRVDQPCQPYNQLGVRIATHHEGDVSARVSIRFDEISESLRLIREICHRLPPITPSPAVELSELNGSGIGCVEGWRGEVLIALDLWHGNIQRCHCHDPSWQNWPVVEHAIIGNIVADFPLINKSFNLCYSGHDL